MCVNVKRGAVRVRTRRTCAVDFVAVFVVVREL